MENKKGFFVKTTLPHYTKEQVITNFSDKVSEENLQILIDHLTNEELSNSIDGFCDIEGKFMLIIDGGFVEIKRKSDT